MTAGATTEKPPGKLVQDQERASDEVGEVSTWLRSPHLTPRAPSASTLFGAQTKQRVRDILLALLRRAAALLVHLHAVLAELGQVLEAVPLD